MRAFDLWLILERTKANKKHHIYHDCPPAEKFGYLIVSYNGFSADTFTFLESVQKLFD